MPTRTLDINGRGWEVSVSGRVTQYNVDEIGLVFASGAGARHEIRVTRYSPVGTRSREHSFAAMSDDDLRRLFESSQPADTSPEANYSA
jgi:hypothetical protein